MIRGNKARESKRQGDGDRGNGQWSRTGACTHIHPHTYIGEFWASKPGGLFFFYIFFFYFLFMITTITTITIMIAHSSAYVDT